MHILFILAELILIGGPQVIPEIPHLLAVVMFYSGITGLILYPAYLLWINRGPLLQRLHHLSWAQIILFASIGGIWVFITAALGAGAWIIWHPAPSVTVVATALPNQPQDDGPIQWAAGLTMEGGIGQNVFSLRFKGANISKQAVQIKDANIFP